MDVRRRCLSHVIPTALVGFLVTHDAEHVIERGNPGCRNALLALFRSLVRAIRFPARVGPCSASGHLILFQPRLILFDFSQVTF